MTGEAITNKAIAAARREPGYEAELVRLAQARSEEAWTEIYERNHSKLFRYLYTRTADQDLAEDLTATVFLEALKSIDSYTSRGRPLLAWLYRIARNVVNYHHRSVFRMKERQAGGRISAAVQRLLPSRRLRDPLDEAAIAAKAGEQADPAMLVEGWDLRDAVNKLSQDQREVIILRYFVGLTTPEVAGVVGKHERAVYSLYTRAIKALRRHLR